MRVDSKEMQVLAQKLKESSEKTSEILESLIVEANRIDDYWEGPDASAFLADLAQSITRLSDTKTHLEELHLKVIQAAMTHGLFDTGLQSLSGNPADIPVVGLMGKKKRRKASKKHDKPDQDSTP